MSSQLQGTSTIERDTVAPRRSSTAWFAGTTLATLVLGGAVGQNLLASTTTPSAPAPTTGTVPAPEPSTSVAACLNEAPWGPADPTCQLAADEAKRRLTLPPPQGTRPYLQSRIVPFCTHQRTVSDDGSPCSPCPDPDTEPYSIQVRTVRPDGAASPWELDGHTCLTTADLDEIGAA